MNRKYLFLIFTLVCGIAWAAGVPERFPTDSITFGKSSSTDDRELIFDTGQGVNNAKLSVDTTNNDFQVNTSFTILDDLLRIGSGSAADQVLEFNIGLGTTNPKLKWDNANGAISFTNDGTNFKPLGSGSGGGSGGVNALADENPDFETASPPQNWSASGGTFTAETTAPIFGSQSGSWDSDALAQTLLSSLGPITIGYVGNTCSVDLSYIYAAGLEGDYKVVVRQYDNSEGFEKDILEIPLGVTATKRRAQQSFTCPDDIADTLGLRIESTVANAGVIILDDAFVGTGNTTFFAVPRNEVQEKVLSSAITINTTASEISYTNLVPGVYYEYRAQFYGRCTTSDATFSVRAVNGAGALIGAWTVGGDSATTDDQQATINATFLATDNVLNFNTIAIDSTGSCLLYGNGTKVHTYTQLEKRNDLGGQFQEGLTVETTGKYLEAALATSGSQIPLSLGTASFLTPNFSTGVVLNFGNLDAEAACVGVEGFGPDCDSEGTNEAAGISFKPHISGLWEVCVSISQGYRLGSSVGTSVNTIWYLTNTTADGTSSLSRSTKQTQVFGETDSSDAIMDGGGNVDLCGTFNLGADKTRFNLQYSQSISGSGLSANTLNVSGSGVDTYFQIWKARPLNQNIPTPIFTDLQESLDKTPKSNEEGLKLCAGQIETASGTGAILRDTGSCVDSTVRTAAGDYTIVFETGYFVNGADPICTVAGNDNIFAACRVLNTGLNQMRVRCSDSAGSLFDASSANEGFEFICLGK